MVTQMAAPKDNDFAKGHGRPSKYTPERDDAVIECGSRGLSLTAYAGEIGVSRSTISEWMNVYPSFSAACQVALAKRTAFLEKGMLKEDATGPMVTARRFALVNAAPDEWSDRKSHEHSAPNGGPMQITEIQLVPVEPRSRAEIEAEDEAEYAASLMRGEE